MDEKFLENFLKVYRPSGFEKEGADVFIRSNEVISIIREVMSKRESSFSELVSPRNPYNFKENFETNPQKGNKMCSVLGIESKKRKFKDFY